jgi:hypothetical protein
MTQAVDFDTRLKSARRVDQAGVIILTVVGMIALGSCLESRDISSVSLFRLLVLAAAVLGMRMSNSSNRLRLSELEYAAQKEHAQNSSERDEVEECKRRRERRSRIRMGAETDDGLSEWGREVRSKPTLRAAQQTMAESGIESFRACEFEDIFGLEKEDEELLAAWDAKSISEVRWREIIARREMYHRNQWNAG